jgi:MazG family protein
MALIERLRAPDGCPWDREQTPASVAPYLLEEAFEAVEAVERGEPAAVAAELGDALFQVAFMSRLFAERGDFGLATVIAGVEAKMRRRHPHVFGEAKAETTEDVRAIWGQVKSQERGQRQDGSQGPEGLLESVPKALPALARAQRLGQRAGRVGFDWPGAAETWEKVAEETGELTRAVGPEEEEAELGDLLFALAQWARHRGLNAEAALRRANARFAWRFSAMEEMACRRGLVLAELAPRAWDDLWEEAKAQGRTGAKNASPAGELDA